MENQGIQHQTSTYISYDSPHIGAHVPLGVLYGFHGILTFLEEKSVLNWIVSKTPSVSSYIKLGEAIAYSNAAQQMLVNYVDTAGRFNNQEHIAWQKELNALGFPKGDVGKSFTMLAVANGSYNQLGVPNYYLKTNGTAGSQLIDYSIILSPLVGTFFGVGLNDIVAGLVVGLPGRTTLDVNVEISPAKSVGDRITYFNIKVKKKFLWVGPEIRRTTFSYERFYPSNYLFDTYPSSTYSLDLDNKGNPFYSNGGEANILYNYNYCVTLSPVPFIPTSSALAYGDGLTTSPSYYFSAPRGTESPFGENYYVHSNEVSHKTFSKEAIDWIVRRLTTTIVGSKIGYDGARYSLSSALGNVQWKTDNTTIATIDGNGVLSVKGKGIVTIIATYGGGNYSMPIMVGVPRYILSATHEPNGYNIKAECIDSAFRERLPNMNAVIKYKWGVKYPNKDIRWFESDSPNVVVQPQGESEKVVVFCQAEDVLGNKTQQQHIEVSSSNIYIISNQYFYVDAASKLYKENKRATIYTYGRIYFKYKPNIDGRYKGREWMVTLALVTTPIGVTRKVRTQDGGPILKDVLSKEELDFIANNSEEGQVYEFMVALQNYKGKTIQLVPVRFVFKQKN